MIATAAGVGMSLIATEHFYSTLLSSPWTTKKFATTAEDKASVRKYYIIAAIASLITAYILSKILNQTWPLISAVILSIGYIVIYENAMKNTEVKA